MSYNKALLNSKQKAVIKSITELLAVLDDIGEVGGGNDTTIVGDDGSVMTLGIEDNRGDDGKLVQKISITITKLNKDDRVIRLVRKKPEKIILKLKKKDINE